MPQILYHYVTFFFLTTPMRTLYFLPHPHPDPFFACAGLCPRKLTPLTALLSLPHQLSLNCLIDSMQQQEIRGSEERKLEVFLPHSLLIQGFIFWQWSLFSMTTAPVGQLSSMPLLLTRLSKLFCLLAPLGPKMKPPKTVSLYNVNIPC